MSFFIFILIFLLSSLLIFTIIKNASFFGLVDVPNERSAHKKITPRGAGIGFASTFFIYFLVFDFFILKDNILLFMALFLVFLCGVIDDKIEISAKVKFVVIFIATYFLYKDGLYIKSFGYFFGYEFSLWYFALPFSMFAVAGFTNALNLIDGLDGLAGSVSIVILSSLLYIGWVNHDILIMKLCFIAIIVVASFLFFNWNPAKIFMGDSGSLFLGFLISTIAILCLKYSHPIALVYIAFIPVADTLVVMLRRIRQGKSPFKPDKTHMHHVLLNFFNKSQKRTVIFITLTQFFFSSIGIIACIYSEVISKNITPFILLLLIFVAIILSYLIFTGMDRRYKLIEKLIQRRNKYDKNWVFQV